MTYDNHRHQTLLAYPEIRDRLILLDGWSKTYAMTGWRLGFSVWPPALYDAARKLAVNSYSCVNAAAQFAGLAALTGPQDAVAAMIAEFDARRRIVVDGLNRAAGRQRGDAQGRLLRLPQHFWRRLAGEAARQRAARGGGRGDDRRAGFRRPWRRLHSPVLRRVARGDHPRAGAHRRFPAPPTAAAVSCGGP